MSKQPLLAWPIAAAVGAGADLMGWQAESRNVGYGARAARRANSSAQGNNIPITPRLANPIECYTFTVCHKGAAYAYLGSHREGPSGAFGPEAAFSPTGSSQMQGLSVV